jgi:magnesium-protoporphyrin O-methyltransferase
MTVPADGGGCSCCTVGAYAETADWPSDVSRLLFAHLERQGFAGRSVLEIGCGYGRILIGAAVGGASRVTGVELDGEALEEAEVLAADEGLDGQIDWVEGDGAEVDLDPHDVVVLDRAICCYPDGRRLVSHSLAAAGQVYAITVPESRGLRGAWNRFVHASMGLWDAVRGEARVYLHDVAMIEALITRAGFRLETRERLGKWYLGIYVR